MRISKTGSNPSAQHALGSGPQPPGHEPVPGSEITKCILVVTPLTFWACDWSILPMETLLRECSRTAVKLQSVDRSAVTKGLWTIALMCIFQALIVDITNCLAHPPCSQFCVACEKWDLFFWTASNFL